MHEWSHYTVGTEAGSPDELITWLFEADSFAPLARLTPQVRYSVVSDHLGTPLELVDEGGRVVWGAQLDSYGRIRQGTGKAGLCPFRYQGQYEDQETGLYYNRFRYYAPQEGMYISQDPSGLNSGEANFYSYTYDTNSIIDPFGLEDRFPTWMPTRRAYQRQHIIPYSLRNHPAVLRSGLGINGATNMMYLPMFPGVDPNPNRSLHNGWNVQHQNYNRIIGQELDNIHAQTQQHNWTDRQVQERVRQLQHDTRRALNNGTLRCG